MKFGKGFGLLFAAFTFLVIGTLMKGWVLSILWEWFAVPVFGLPRLSIASALGVALVVGFMTHQYQSSDEGQAESETSDLIAAGMVHTITYPLSVLAIGAIIQLFM